MPTYVVSKFNGEISQVITGGARYIEVPEGSDISDDSHYVDVTTTPNEIRKREEISFGLKIEGLVVTLTGLPVGLTVSTNKLSTVTDNEPLLIEYDVPGTYRIALSGRVNCLDRELEVTVGDP
ncbi:hypothetical protein [Vreelandella venusta]|uniref:hypothetical protein n=1 Tax=Vreelandella venusta TaxID=44935 RepID=UPI0018DA84AB|nr:hypothetical protein [Halomonas venusta]QPI65942.1 hypothetical protein IR195_09695 [Halomonas venusta]